MQQANLDSVLLALTKDRMRDIGRRAGVALRSGTKKDYASRLTDSQRLPFRDLLAQMKRDELRAACRSHELDDSGRARQELMQRLLDAHGDAGSIAPAPLFSQNVADRFNPKAGDTVRARHRQWLVDEVWHPVHEGDATRLRLTCLDDDNRGAVTELLWELELGAEVIRPEAELLRKVDQIDDPRHFAAYYHALQWQGVTATEKGRFQSPFRAGIQIQTYQLTPLQKALSLPRANLFIADDVGLGKTIEAGLVLQELLLRQQVDFALIVCPASLTLQWRDEMEQRFGLSFEVYTRDFVLTRRRERGFGVNPWTTHNRFIISYPLIRRPEYRDPLLQHLGERVKKSLLILDEAHTAAPASASRYAVDSRITKVIRDIAPRFENRLFLSATPHNGHSNSFSALLEILDPQRFTRGVPVSGPEALEPVMVRRLKKDLKAISTTRVPFPDREVVRIALHHDGAAWNASFGGAPRKPIGETEPFELRLSELLAEYTALMTGSTKKRRRLTFITLQKRLLSGVEALHRTLKLHAKAVGMAKPHSVLLQSDEEVADAQTAQGIDEESHDETEDAKVAADSAGLDSPEDRAKDLLHEMQTLARAHRRDPDAKVKALLAWMKEHQCAGLSFTDAPAKSDRSWTGRRVLIFTEYGDTRRYLRDLLRTAVADTDHGDERILEIYGGMNDEDREAVQYAFNAPPDEHPVRILIATDAAREGLNLQGHCADLFHMDIPWNPSRMEQRNGRIDRALQPEPEVRCHYFVYEQRGEDRVLAKVVEKTEIIQRELGSLATVVLERVEGVLRGGITDETDKQLDLATGLDGDERHKTTKRELEATRQLDRLKAEIDQAAKIFDASKKVMHFHPEHLRDAIDVGLELSGADQLQTIDSGENTDNISYRIPELSIDWQRTLDRLRPPRSRDEAFYDWRKKPPRPVVFHPPKVLTSTHVHLHLEHPFVKRVLSRFLAQGYGQHDLSRVTVLPVSATAQASVLAVGRLCLFGSGAGRLHDTLLCVGAHYSRSSGASNLVPVDAEQTRRLVEMLDRAFEKRPSLETFSETLLHELRKDAPLAMETLWPALRAEADAHAVDADQKLKTRGATDAKQLRKIIQSRRDAIDEALGGSQLNLTFGDSESDRLQAKQMEQDRKHLERRRVELEQQREREPRELEALYDVKLRRFEPVGLIYLWPEMG